MVSHAELDGLSQPYPGGRAGSRAETLQRALSAALTDDGEPDIEFDEAYPPMIRAVSSRFWTPVRVALRAARLLVTSPDDRVLDIGSGVGKFCIVGAAATGATFVGVEHRARFVSVAQRAALTLGVTSARFECSPFDLVEVQDFDALYLFNPFEENLWDPVERLDETVPHSLERYARDTVQVEHMLARARVGTRVVTYHGFGSDIPPGFQRVLRERQRSGYLELWTKSEHVTWSPRPVRGVSSWLPGGRIRALQAMYRAELTRGERRALDGERPTGEPRLDEPSAQPSSAEAFRHGD